MKNMRFMEIDGENIDYTYISKDEEKQKKYDELKIMLGNKLSDKFHPIEISAVAYEDENILLKLFPEIEEKMHKGLIDINLLKPVSPGIFRKDKYLIFAHRYFRRNCSLVNSYNAEFLKRLQNLASYDLKVQIALDVNLIGLSGTESEEFEHQYWWGPKFSDDLSRIPFGVTRHENESVTKRLDNVCCTDFGWYMQDNHQTFECEEVINRANITMKNKEFYGCRFVHSMINPNTLLPNHLDGAIRAYTDKEMVERTNMNLDKTDRNKLYTKLWRIDNDVNVILWKELITHYYRDNMLVGEYFLGDKC